MSPDMSIVEVIPAADRPDVPWKNAGGTTSEIAVFPPDAGMDDFLWRLSMARVEREGPFSAFPGIERTLAVIEGELALTGPDLRVTLDDRAEPLVFDGGAAVHGVPLAGPVRDLNAMVRCGAYAVSMARLDGGEHAQCAGIGFVVALEAQRCGVALLEAFDCARISSPVMVEGPALFVNFVALSPS